MKKINKILRVSAIVFALAIGIVGCGNVNEQEASQSAKGSQENFTIRVGVCSGDNNHLLKVLDDHTGFLKDRGINLEVTEFAAGINTIDAITTNQLDIGLFADYAGVNRIGNTLDDTDLRAFATINKTNAYDLYVDPEKVKTPEDIVGKTVISMAGVVYEYDYGKLFEKYNIDPESVNVVNVSSVQEALAIAQSKEGIAFWVHSSIAPEFEKQGWKSLLSIGDIDATMYTFLVANNSFLTKNQSKVAKFLSVSEEAFQYIDENKDEFFSWVEADLGLKKELGIANWDASDHKYTFEQEAYEDLVKVEKWCYNNGNFDKDYDVGDFINTDALKEVSPDRVNWTKK